MKTRQRDNVGLVLRALPDPSEFGRKEDSDGNRAATSKARLDLLVEVPGRRRKLTNEQFSELVENLALNPLASPVTCRRRDDGMLEIISGHNRVAAYRELERTEIDVHIVELDDDQVERAAFYANLLSNELPDYHKYLGFKARMTSTGKNQTEIAEEAGINRSVVTRLMAFGTLPSLALSVIEKSPERFGYNGVLELSKLVDSYSAETISQTLEKVANEEVSLKQAISLIKASGKSKTKVEPEVITIRKGNATFCSVRKTGSSLRLDFAGTTITDSLMEDIENVIKRYAVTPSD